MIFVFSYLLLLLFSEIHAILKVKDSLKKKDLAFVESLKQGLRRNNDDYADILHSSVTRSSNYTQQSFVPSNLNTDKNKLRLLNTTSNDMVMRTDTMSETNYKLQSLQIDVTEPSSDIRRKNNKEDERFKIIDEIKKRVDDALLPKVIKEKKSSEGIPQRRKAIDTQILVHNYSKTISTNNIPTRWTWKDLHKIKHRISDKVIQNQLKAFSKKNSDLTQSPVLTTLSNLTTVKNKTVNQIKKKKLEKFKNFIEKNKGLLKDFISSKVAIQTPAVPVPQNLSLRQKGKDHSKRLRELEFQQVMNEAMEGLKRKESLERMPRAELLDLAPAKGGLIHRKRLKGRLCQRHVLLPEGPKYSSGGRAYVPPHAGGRAREYNATAEPTFLLPRCCNCCRKSVLGCE